MSTLNFTGTFWTVTDGNWYVSYRGNDDNDGSPGKPFATIAKAIAAAASGDRIVIGSGQYGEYVDGGGKNCLIYGDGYVELTGTESGIAFSNMGYASEIYNIKRISGYSALAVEMKIVSGCFFDQTGLFGFYELIEDCVFSDSSFGFYSGAPLVLKHNTFIGVYAEISESIIAIKNCHFDNTAFILQDDTNLAFFDYCSCDNVVINFLLAGDTRTSASDIHSYNSAYMAHGIDTVAGYNDADRFDFSLTADSPLRYADSNGRFIGAHGFENIFESATLTSPLLNNTTLNDDDNYNVTIAGNIATITTGIIDLGSTRQLGVANLYASMLFMVDDFDFAVDESSLPTTPEILTFSLRFSDNLKLLERGNYKSYRWSELISNDATGKGNGDPVFNSQTALPVEARYIQFKITMSDTTFYLLQQNSGRINIEDNSGKILHKNV